MSKGAPSRQATTARRHDAPFPAKEPPNGFDP